MNRSKRMAAWGRMAFFGSLLLSAAGLSAADDYRLVVSGTWPVASSATVATADMASAEIGSCSQDFWTFTDFKSDPPTGSIIIFR